MGKSLVVLVGDRKNKILPDQVDLELVNKIVSKSGIAKNFDNILVYSDLIDFVVIEDKDGVISKLKTSAKEAKEIMKILEKQNKKIQIKCKKI